MEAPQVRSGPGTGGWVSALRFWGPLSSEADNNGDYQCGG